MTTGDIFKEALQFRNDAGKGLVDKGWDMTFHSLQTQHLVKTLYWHCQADRVLSKAERAGIQEAYLAHPVLKAFKSTCPGISYQPMSMWS